VTSSRTAKNWRHQKGYALISLLAGLTILLVMMSVAVPSIKHEAQRELEEEMLFRGQQVAFALGRYRTIRGRLPTKLEELVEKVETPKGTMRFLRESALCDPLMPCEDGKSNWKPARPGDHVFTRFFEAYVQLRARYPERNMPPPPGELAQLAQLGAKAQIPGGQGDQQGGPPTSEFSKSNQELGPIYGVTSTCPKPMIRNYMDLPTYDESLFFTGFVVNAGGTFNPVSVVAGAQAPQAQPTQDPRCPGGGIWFEQGGQGFCAGVIKPGKLCRGPDGTTVPCPEGQK